MEWPIGARCFYCHEVADENAKSLPLRAHQLVLLICSVCWKKVME